MLFIKLLFSTNSTILQAKTPLAKWKDKSFPLFDNMAKLCRDVIVTGENVFCTGTTMDSSRSSVGIDGTDWNDAGMNSDIEEVTKVCTIYASYGMELT